MQRLAVFYDDVDHARHLLEPMLAPADGPRHWVMVACAPKLTHRIGKWVSNVSREKWRQQWADRQRSLVEPWLVAGVGAGQVDWMLARTPLDALTRKLRERHGAGLQVLDARRPKLGHVAEALVPGHGEPATGRGLAAPLAMSSGLALVLALSD